MFPNQLMRVSHLHEAGGMSASCVCARLAIKTVQTQEMKNAIAGRRRRIRSGWQHEPARSEAPAFRASCSHRGAAYLRFEAADREFHAWVNVSKQELTRAVDRHPQLSNDETRGVRANPEARSCLYTSINACRDAIPTQGERRCCSCHARGDDDAGDAATAATAGCGRRAFSLKPQHWVMARGRRGDKRVDRKDILIVVTFLF